MVSLDDKVRALAVTAGWKPPRPEKDGSYRFRLEDGLDLKIFSPDGRWCFLLAELLSLPEAGHDRDSLLRKWRASRPASAVSALRSWPLSIRKTRRPGIGIA